MKADMMFGWRPTAAPSNKPKVEPGKAKIVPIPLTYYDVRTPYMGYIAHSEGRPDADFQPKVVFSGFRPKTSFHIHSVFESGVELAQKPTSYELKLQSNYSDKFLFDS